MKLRTIILILGMAACMVMADNWVVSPILPSIASGIGVPVTLAGLLITSYMIPFGLAQLVFGPLADRFGKREVIILAMGLFTIGTLLTGLGTTLINLGLFRAITGLFAAAVIPVSIAWIADIVPMSERQGAIGMFLGMAITGQGLSMAIGGSIAYLFSWRCIFFIFAALSLAITCWLFVTGRHVPSIKNPNAQYIAPYMTLLTGKSGWIYLIAAIEGFLILGQFSFLGGFIGYTYHFNNLYIGLIMTIFCAGAIIGSRSSGPVAGKIGREKLLMLGFSVTVIASGMFYLGGFLALLIAGIALLGLGNLLAYSTILTMATEFAAQARGSATSLVVFFFMVGGGIGTAIASRVVGTWGYPTLFAVYGVGLVLLVLLIKLLAVDNIYASHVELE